MQAIANLTQTRAGRGGSLDDVNQRTGRLFRLFGLRAATLLPAILICLLVPAGSATAVAQTMSPTANAAAQSDAKKAFEKMKALAGSWQGTVMGKSINITIRVASSGHAILHEATAGSPPPDREMTMFYLDGDRLLANHYCDGGNLARWEGKMSPDGKSIEFSFLDVAGGTRGGYLRGMVFTVIDANRHSITAPFILPDGKPIELRGDFQRVNVNLSAGSRRLYDGGAMMLLLSAQKMPEEYYSFKPTEADLSFGQMLAEVANWQYKNCSAVLGEKDSRSKIEAAKTSKADLIAALKEAFAYCGKAYDGLTDASAAQLVTFSSLAGPFPMPRQLLLDTNTGLNSLHYGNLMIYLRLKNIVPPSGDPELLKQAEKLLKK